MWSSISRSDVDWKFKFTPQKHLNGREVAHPQGRVLRGLGAINAGSWIPPSAAVVNAWGNMGRPEAETSSHLGLRWINEQVKGTSRPIQVSFLGLTEDPMSKAWVDSFKTLNHEIAGDPFAGKSTGGYSNPSSVDPTSKTRGYSVSAYLEPVRKQANLKIMTDTTVERIIFSGSDIHTAQGVEIPKDGKSISIFARKEVVLAAGTSQSPKLLELSGIGGEHLLRSLDVPVLIDNPNVGGNLQDHLMTGISFEVKDGINTRDPMLRQETHAIQKAMKMFVEEKKGQLCLAGIGSYAFMLMVESDTQDGKQAQDELIDTYISEEDDPMFRDHIRSLLKSPEEGSGALFMILAKQIGMETLHNLKTPPKIDSNYLSYPLYIEVYARHILFLQTLAKTESLALYLKLDGKRNHPTAFLKDLEDAKEYARATSVPEYHYSGMYAMLPRDEGGVVNERLLVHGTKNLRVVDASIMPLCQRGNCQTSVYAVAERAADLIKMDHGLKL